MIFQTKRKKAMRVAFFLFLLPGGQNCIALSPPPNSEIIDGNLVIAVEHFICRAIFWPFFSLKIRPLFTIQALQASAAGPAPQGGPVGPQGCGAPKPRSLGVPEPRGLGGPRSPKKPDYPRGPKGHPPPLLTQFYVLTYSY